ncbi:MAG: hypothetical protein HY548_00605 [Elusimicrobia bacterium]|nr:hypothetical protein [Elusimicrobiota bacterium]
MSTWEDVKKKIQNLEKDPFVDADMLRTMDTISIADYWRRRFEEEHALSERKMGGKEEEVHQLKDRVERQVVDLQLLHQQLDSARTQLVDKQRYWEERHHNLELENRSLKDRMDWEIKSRVLEEQNRFLAERLRRPQETSEEPPTGASKKELESARAQAQELQAKLAVLEGEKGQWQTERARLAALAQEAEALRNAKAEWEEKARLLEKESVPVKEENGRLQDLFAALSGRMSRLKAYLDLREKDHLTSLEDLGRGFAHRVRNYLGIMSGTLQLCLANYKMEDELKEQVTLVDENAQEMLKAIEEFLSLVRVPEMNLETLDLNAFFSRALAALEDKFKAANVKLQWDGSAPVPPVSVDTRLMGEAVSALATNALEAMAEGGRLAVDAALDETSRAVRVRFRDSGKGINDNHLRKVFQPYFTTKKGHKGLGLAVCKRIMELHRGAMELESVKGEGTVVTLVFPVPETPSAGSPVEPSSNEPAK